MSENTEKDLSIFLDNRIGKRVAITAGRAIGLRWFVGLGNPGKAYERTRHNIGFMAVDRLAARWGIELLPSKFRALAGEGLVCGQKVFLLKPTTFMNLSGESVRAFMDFYRVGVEGLVLLYDDMDTPFGKIRLRYKGSSGGHNGVESVIQHVGTQLFNRIRIGISRPEPGASTVDYVLSEFTKEERERLPDILERAADAAEASLTEPFEKVMARFNAG